MENSSKCNRYTMTERRSVIAQGWWYEGPVTAKNHKGAFWGGNIFGGDIFGGDRYIHYLDYGDGFTSISMSKFIIVYTLNMYNLLYASYSSMKNMKHLE